MQRIGNEILKNTLNHNKNISYQKKNNRLFKCKRSRPLKWTLLRFYVVFFLFSCGHIKKLSIIECQNIYKSFLHTSSRLHITHITSCVCVCVFAESNVFSAERYGVSFRSMWGWYIITVVPVSKLYIKWCITYTQFKWHKKHEMKET